MSRAPSVRPGLFLIAPESKVFDDCPTDARYKAYNLGRGKGMSVLHGQIVEAMTSIGCEVTIGFLRWSLCRTYLVSLINATSIDIEISASGMESTHLCRMQTPMIQRITY